MVEDFLSAIVTGDTSGLPEPVSRTEKYLAYALGIYTGELPVPASRNDVLLRTIALAGVGGNSDTTALRQQIATLTAENSALRAEKEAIQTEAETALDEINAEVVE